MDLLAKPLALTTGENKVKILNISRRRKSKTSRPMSPQFKILTKEMSHQTSPRCEEWEEEQDEIDLLTPKPVRIDTRHEFTLSTIV